MDTTTSFNSCVKLEAEAVDNCHNSSDSVAAEDAQQLALEQATQDMDLACASLKISSDPGNWNFDDVRRWLIWTIKHYNLPDGSVDLNLFAVNGATLCAWSEYEFVIRSIDCGEILNTLLDVWKSTGKMRRNNNNSAPAVVQQQQIKCEADNIIMRSINTNDSASYPTQYGQQFNNNHFQQQQQNTSSMSYMPSPPPTYYSTMMMMQQQQQQRLQTKQTLFFNAPLGADGSAPSPPMSVSSPMNSSMCAGGMYSMQQHRLPPQQLPLMSGQYHQLGNNNMLTQQQQLQQQQQHSQLFMGNIMPTPSPSNSTGNYGSDDCESLESYDMRTATVAAAAAAAAALTSNGSVAQCLINANGSGNLVVNGGALGAPPVATTTVGLYDKYYGNPPGQANIHLWQFVKELLSKPDIHSTCIRWVERSKGVFKIEDSVRVAKLWGKRKNRPAMNYDKLSRSIRQYYKKGIMKKTEKSQRLVYQFCHPYCC